MSSNVEEKAEHGHEALGMSGDAQTQLMGAEPTLNEKTPGSTANDSLKPDVGHTSGTMTPSGAPDIMNGDAASAEKAAHIAQEKSPRDVHGFVWVITVLSILSTTFLFALDNTIVADIQPAIVERFGSIEKLPWLSVAFLVAAAGTNLVW